ncbi:MAG: nitrile hydratase accessory protein [Pseudonocardia sp.]|nr:nitrile hydratase accessory protein [Pseudonocardia sp.]
MFAQPWHAQAFALAVTLHEQGRFAWPEFSDELAATVRADPDGEYYRSWLTALERVVVAHGLMTAEDLVEREDAWHRAARATPHGSPITLGSVISGSVISSSVTTDPATQNG